MASDTDVMMSDSPLRGESALLKRALRVSEYGTYRILVYDSEGNITQQQTLESTGSFTIEKVKQNVMINDVEEIEVQPLCIETRRDGKTEMRIEATDYDHE